MRSKLESYIDAIKEKIVLPTTVAVAKKLAPRAPAEPCFACFAQLCAFAFFLSFFPTFLHSVDAYPHPHREPTPLIRPLQHLFHAKREVMRLTAAASALPDRRPTHGHLYRLNRTILHALAGKLAL
jgi:hypothetical protein